MSEKNLNYKCLRPFVFDIEVALILWNIIHFGHCKFWTDSIDDGPSAYSVNDVGTCLLGQFI